MLQQWLSLLHIDTSMVDTSPILFILTPGGKYPDISYVNQLKPMLKGRKALVIDANPDSIAEVGHYCKMQKIKYVVTTNRIILNKLIDVGKTQNIDDWAGSLYEHNGITYLFLNALRQFFSVNHGRFIAERFLSKIISPNLWPTTPEFSWELSSTDSINHWYSLYQKCIAIAVDIETINYVDEAENTSVLIRCVCYTGLWRDGNIHTIVIPICEAEQTMQPYWIMWMRKFNLLEVPKIFQNGLYDNAHFVTYGAPTLHYFWDTQSLFHSWFSELPKRLDFIAAFTIHNVFYWKDMAYAGGVYKLFEYNARDGWATMVSFLGLLRELPQWAINNYCIKFPLWVPCLASNLEGFAVDGLKRYELIEHYKATFETHRDRLRRWFGAGFNPNSPDQVRKLIHFYGSTDLDSGDKFALRKFALRHPLNARFVGEITECRETAKIISTYLKPTDYSISEKAGKRKSYLLKHGRLFYALNPDGTDTGRLSCSDGPYWTGAQIQNISPKIKEMLVADEGWEIFEIDNERSESYCTGYLSGDKNLLEVLRQDREEGKDFHGINASNFFGMPFDEVMAEHEATNDPSNTSRYLSKRINHGATYNMGDQVLLQTMGELNVDKARKLLGLPSFWNRLRVCGHLLQCWETAFPTIKSDTGFYGYIKTCVDKTSRLVSQLGWTRHCFGRPSKSRPDLNAYVAHVPQNLSVGIVNEAFQEIYWKVQAKNPKNFRLKAQVHDSILGQVRLGHRHLIKEAALLCIRPKEITDCHNTKRVMQIPVATKVGPNWGQMKKFKFLEYTSNQATDVIEQQLH